MDALSDQVPRRLGEVIETSTARIWAECDRLNVLPRLGSVVQVGTMDGDTVLAVVTFCQTSGVDSTRRAVRRGSDEVRDEEIYRRHPELTRVLRSTFEAAPVAYLHGDTLRCIVPPVPPPLHYSVASSPREIVMRLTDRLDYLPMLARYTGELAGDQVVIAHIRETYEVRGCDDAWLERVAASIGKVYAEQYDLLLPILQAIDPSADSDSAYRHVR